MRLPDLTQEEIDKFNFYVIKTDNCWLWDKGIDNGGYGVFYWHSKFPLKAHRVAYKIAYGPFDNKLHILHRCDNPPCVNPEHLFLGTNKDNIDDKIRKGRQKRALPSKEEKEVIDLCIFGFTNQQISDWYECGRGTISNIARRSGVIRRATYRL